ncbi:glycoside hydrolase 5 family protein [Reichenbachiella ulvae]|uniref:mannan endo-1,4-beta-mannosidase n=1 Tax=Reichenbachiella ulvae TaxID=2980104 RepID=A0ABT3CSZ4_9BACT|nr:cellulase family glycosylhydrolase [Reichenbachiella ulvae]MCV9386816.1 cellulase family glycosylhydrolase [Reichenbachiella ulvae]
MKKYYWMWVLAIVFAACSQNKKSNDTVDVDQQTEIEKDGFVKVNGLSFEIDGEPYRYIGTNFWYGMNLGSPGEGGDRERLVRELDRLQALGLKNLRVMAASEGAEDSPYQNKPILQTAPGEYNQELLEGLDFFFVELAKRDMKAVVCLGNFWMWSGGFPQYVSWAEGSEIPYPDVMGGGSWDDFISYSESFYSNEKAQQYYFDFLKFIINRTNSLTGQKYKEDPTVMAWQLANEPRGYNHVEEYRVWLNKAAALIKEQDQRHLVCTGTEGDTSTPISGTELYEDNLSPDIDYATTHVWIQNWGWYNPENEDSYAQALQKSKDYLKGQEEKAKRLGKPLVIEEFGVSRNGGNFYDSASVSVRNDYYEFLFDYTVSNIKQNGIIQGCNFWSWGGEGRPANPGMLWEPGDDLIGDPAHERQGWYSVYETDSSTIELIKSYTSKI